MSHFLPIRLRPLVLALLYGAAACAPDSDPLLYEERRPFDPPAALYDRWWSELVACSGRSRDVAGIRWFLADWIGGDDAVRGQWISSREITIHDGYEYAEWVVKHEMLHDLLDGDGTHTHRTWGRCVPDPP